MVIEKDINIHSCAKVRKYQPRDQNLSLQHRRYKNQGQEMSERLKITQEVEVDVFVTGSETKTVVTFQWDYDSRFSDLVKAVKKGLGSNYPTSSPFLKVFVGKGDMAEMNYQKWNFQKGHVLVSTKTVMFPLYSTYFFREIINETLMGVYVSDE